MKIYERTQDEGELHPLRIGIPTSSEFSKLVTSTGGISKSMDDYAMVLAVEKYAGKAVDDWGGNGYTERGKELEALARADYEMVNQVAVTQVGFVTDDLIRYGASTDGLVNDDGIVEFKCQIAKEHIKSYIYYKKHNKPPTTFVAQCQGEMFVCEREYVDLVFFHPDLPSFTIRQTPNPEFVKVLKAQLKAVEAQRNIFLKTIQEI